MFKVETTPKFDKKYLKLIKKNFALKIRIRKSIKQLQLDPKHPGLRSHQINDPEFGKIWSSWVHGDLRIFWKYEGDKIIILLLDIDDHDHIY